MVISLNQQAGTGLTGLTGPQGGGAQNAGGTVAPGTEPVVGPALVIDGDTKSFAADVIEASKTVPVLVDFWAPWCGPCKTLGPLLEKLVREYGGSVRLVKINVDENQGLASQLRVQSIPMVFGFKDGQPADAFTGALPESQLRQFIDKLTGDAGSPIDLALDGAKQAMAAGDLDGAGRIYGQILEDDDANTAAAAGLARVFMAQGDTEGARKFIDGLAEGMADDAEIAAARSAVELAEAGAESGEADALREAVAADANDHQARFDLAVALFADADAEAAIDELIEIVKRKPGWDDGAARGQLLKIFEALGNADPVTVAGRRKLSAILFS